MLDQAVQEILYCSESFCLVECSGSELYVLVAGFVRTVCGFHLKTLYNVYCLKKMNAHNGCFVDYLCVSCWFERVSLC